MLSTCVFSLFKLPRLAPFVCRSIPLALAVPAEASSSVLAASCLLEVEGAPSSASALYLTRLFGRLSRLHGWCCKLRQGAVHAKECLCGLLWALPTKLHCVEIIVPFRAHRLFRILNLFFRCCWAFRCWPKPRKRRRWRHALDKSHKLRGDPEIQRYHILMVKSVQRYAI